MAIRDQSYTRYEGPLREKNAWAAIGWTGFRTYWQFWRTKLTFLAVWLVPLIFAMAIIAEYALRSQIAQMGTDGAPGIIGFPLFMQLQIFSLALIFSANGCGIVADDMRHRTIQLYFSKPITRFEYGLGKYLTLLIMATFTSILPAALLLAMRTAFFARTDYLQDVALLHLKGFLLVVIISLVMCAIVIGLSCLTRRTGYAVLTFIGVLIVPLIIHAIVGVASEGSPLAGLFSLPGTVSLATHALLSPETLAEEIPAFAPFAVLAGVFIAGLGSLYWRISKLEGIT